MEIKNTLRKIRDLYCYGDFFMNRGQAVINSFYEVIKYVAFAGIVVELINKSVGGRLGFVIPLEAVIYAVPVLMVIMILIGVIDIKKVHALQKINELSTKYNPYLVRLITNSRNNNDNDNDNEDTNEIKK